ncbi:hypothetical protein MMC25_006652 [Agyrium rufum]|nr:hypothetical protein [Agyrium rufum]
MENTEKIDEAESLIQPARQIEPPKSSVWKQYLPTLALVLLALLSGVVIGRETTGLSKRERTQRRSTSRIFDYNLTYVEAPSERTNMAWAELQPNGGLVNHPYDDTKAAGLSAFHQIHCIDAIRRTYYALLEGTTDPDVEDPFYHSRHCFDYLRQSVMCAGDMTIEMEGFEANGTSKGITGIGAEHRCVDWDALVDWAAESFAKSKYEFKDE